MQNRISEMENDEVDYLRFDRIKIQRKRMEHILEVIKDLSFKNKQLFKENAALKQERLHESHYQKLYRQLNAQRAILIDKNLQMSSQLEKYRETVLHQQILINSLKQELYGENLSIYRNNFHEMRQKQAQNEGENEMVAEQYKILEIQYEDLKKEYSKLYKKYSSKRHSTHKCSPNKSVERSLCGKQNENSKILYSEFKNRQNSNLKGILGKHRQSAFEYDNQLAVKLKEKYDKCKKAKKQLSNQVKILRESLCNYQIRQKRHVQLIEILKQKRTKICLCHVNKLKKIMSQTMFENTGVPHQPTSHN